MNMKTKKVTPTELRHMLAKGKVTFQFTKKNGEIRTAVGTNNPDMIEKTPTGGYNPAKESGYTPFWDLEKKGFRCFDESKVIGVVED